jgi:hypothetical protein
VHSVTLDEIYLARKRCPFRRAEEAKFAKGRGIDRGGFKMIPCIRSQQITLQAIINQAPEISYRSDLLLVRFLELPLPR